MKFSGMELSLPRGSGRARRGGEGSFVLFVSPVVASFAGGVANFIGGVPMMHRPEMARVVPGRKCGAYVYIYIYIRRRIARVSASDGDGVRRVSLRANADPRVAHK